MVEHDYNYDMEFELYCVSQTVKFIFGNLSESVYVQMSTAVQSECFGAPSRINAANIKFLMRTLIS